MFCRRRTGCRGRTGTLRRWLIWGRWSAARWPSSSLSSTTSSCVPSSRQSSSIKTSPDSPRAPTSTAWSVSSFSSSYFFLDFDLDLDLFCFVLFYSFVFVSSYLTKEDKFNEWGMWVCSVVLAHEKVNDRVSIIAYFIELAKVFSFVFVFVFCSSATPFRVILIIL